MKKLFLSAFLATSFLAGSAAQDSTEAGNPAPESNFKLIGDVNQTLQTSATAWDAVGSPLWTIAADLRPQFTTGNFSVLADTTVTALPSGSLNAVTSALTIYEAYLRVTPLDGLDLTLGQKRLNLGVGQTFTVGDTINPSVGFFDQKTGFRGVTASWSPNAWFGWTAGLSAERNLGNDRWLPSAVAPGSDADRLSGASQVSVLLDKFQGVTSFVYSPDRTFNPAVGASYDLGGIILTGEGAVEFLPEGRVPSSSGVATWTPPQAWTSPDFSGSVGARYTYSLGDWDITGSAEYLYWGQGWTNDEIQDWKNVPGAQSQLAAQVRAQTPLRSQNNGFFKLSFADGDVFSVNSLFVVDLQDASTLGQFLVSYVPWEGLELVVTFEAAWGASGTSWALLPPTPTLGLTSATQYVVLFQTKYHL